MFSVRSKALALVVAAAAIGAPVAQAEFIPGVTDFPSVPVQPAYVAGVTDFPSRLGSQAEQAAQDRIARRAGWESPSTAVERGFDWGAAGLGAGVSAVGLLLAAAALRTRLHAGAVLAHESR